LRPGKRLPEGDHYVGGGVVFSLTGKVIAVIWLPFIIKAGAAVGMRGAGLVIVDHPGA
jgi:hypothetical protein